MDSCCSKREGGPIEEIRPGDMVWFAPGEKHWHGTTPTTAAVGGHSLRAEYSGSANHSASATELVNGQKVTLTATVAAVAPGKRTPTSSIIFRDGTAELGS